MKLTGWMICVKANVVFHFMYTVSILYINTRQTTFATATIKLSWSCDWKGGIDVCVHSVYRGDFEQKILFSTSDFSLHCKKRFSIFTSQAGMSLTKLSLARNSLIFLGQGKFDQWYPGWGLENRYPFLQCGLSNKVCKRICFCEADDRSCSLTIFFTTKGFLTILKG